MLIMWTLNINLVKVHNYLNNASSKAYSFEKLMKRQRGHQRSDGAGTLRCSQRHPDDHRVNYDPQLQNLETFDDKTCVRASKGFV